MTGSFALNKAGEVMLYNNLIVWLSLRCSVRFMFLLLDVCVFVSFSVDPLNTFGPAISSVASNTDSALEKQW